MALKQLKNSLQFYESQRVLKVMCGSMEVFPLQTAESLMENIGSLGECPSNFGKKSLIFRDGIREYEVVEATRSELRRLAKVFADKTMVSYLPSIFNSLSDEQLEEIIYNPQKMVAFLKSPKRVKAPKPIMTRAVRVGFQHMIMFFNSNPVALEGCEEAQNALDYMKNI